MFLKLESRSPPSHDFFMEITKYRLIQFIESINLSDWQLIALSLLGLLAITICIRELLSWYLKVNDLKADIRELSDQVKELKAMINSSDLDVDVTDLESLTYPVEETTETHEPTFSLKETKKEATTSFPIDH